MASACTQRDAAPALRRLVSCSSSAASPVCAWTGLRVFDGGPVRPGLAKAHSCARVAFDAFVCGLPRWRGAKIQPPDWAFGSEPATAGKFVARWAMSLFLASVAEQPGRYSIPTPELTGWLWRPPGSCAASNGTTEAWVRADVCRTSVRAPRGLELALERSSVGQQLLRQVPPPSLPPPASPTPSAHSPPPPLPAPLPASPLPAPHPASPPPALPPSPPPTPRHHRPRHHRPRHHRPRHHRPHLQVRGNSSGQWAARTDLHWMATAGGGVTLAGLWWAGLGLWWAGLGLGLWWAG